MSDPNAAPRDSTRGGTDPSRPPRDSWPAVPIAGVIVLAVGVIFLLDNFGFHLPSRWWAVFVLIPAAASLVTAARFYRVDGRFSGRAAGATTGGLLLLAVALILFLNLSWHAFWPVLLIIVGAGLIARGYRRGG